MVDCVQVLGRPVSFRAALAERETEKKSQVKLSEGKEATGWCKSCRLKQFDGLYRLSSPSPIVVTLSTKGYMTKLKSQIQ